MNKIVNETKIKNLRISHIVRKTPYNMSRRHMHIEYEIYYLIEGQRYYFIDDRSYLVTPGSLVLVPSGNIHKTASISPTDCHERLLIILNEEWINPFLNKTGLPPLATYFQNGPVLQLDPAKQEHVLRIYESINTELSTKQPHYEAAVKMKLAELFLLISRCNAPTTDLSVPLMNKSPKHKKVAEATFYIKEHFHEPLSLQQVADHIYVSRGYLSNIFNEVTGMKLTEYINIQRVNYAKDLLSSTNDSITNIATSCGFDSITYFERIFNQITGMSPLKYRQSMQSGK